MTYYAIFKTESGDEESILIAEGAMLTFNSNYYFASLESLRSFLQDKTIVSGKGKEVSFEHVLSQIKMMQENPTIQSRLHEEMITGSSLDIHRDEDSLIYFKWKKEL